jgi:gamma-glutamyltranspeptidase/glutathione hydrolase
MQAARPTDDPGLMTLADLRGYRALWRSPLVGSYRGRQVVAMPPPTSGGTAILEMLNVLEGFDLGALGRSSAQAVHLVADAQRIAWADRNSYLADPGFVAQPIARLTSKPYADGRRAEIDPFATKAFGPAPPELSGSTTQVSVVDAKGDAASLTCTIEQEWGSGVVAPGTGFLLNNELTDFGSAGTANEAAGGKRPRSSMSPTIVSDAKGRPVLVTGAAGGSRIIMGVLHSILGVVDYGDTLAQAVDAERFDDQGSARLSIEDGRFDPAVLAELEARGYTLDRQGEYFALPRVQLAGIDPLSERPTAVSDSRSDRGSLAVR